jgi:hypothetical protein
METTTFAELKAISQSTVTDIAILQCDCDSSDIIYIWSS